MNKKLAFPLSRNLLQPGSGKKTDKHRKKNLRNVFVSIWLFSNNFLIINSCWQKVSKQNVDQSSLRFASIKWTTQMFFFAFTKLHAQLKICQNMILFAFVLMTCRVGIAADSFLYIQHFLSWLCYHYLLKMFLYYVIFWHHNRYF